MLDLVSMSNNESKIISPHRSNVKTCQVPIVLYKESVEYIAECPLFYVSSHGHNEKEALDRVKEALQLYLADSKVQDKFPTELECSEEAMFKKSEELFNEYSEPDEQHPEYSFRKIVVCVH